MKHDVGLVMEDASQSFHVGASIGPQNMDIDVDEIKDRIDLLKDTVDQLGND